MASSTSPSAKPVRPGLNRTSARITKPRSQGASEAILLGTGLQPADLDKPQVGIASMWYEGNTSNMHLDRLAAKVREEGEDVVCLLEGPENSTLYRQQKPQGGD